MLGRCASIRRDLKEFLHDDVNAWTVVALAAGKGRRICAESDSGVPVIAIAAALFSDLEKLAMYQGSAAAAKFSEIVPEKA